MMLNQKMIAMPKTYLISKRRRKEHADYETSYCFGNVIGKWLQFNKKATTLLECDDHFKVTFADWYIDVNHNDKYIDSIIKRQYECERLEEEYFEKFNK